MVNPKKVGLAVLFEAERKEVHSKPNKPLHNRLEETTWARYQSPLQQEMSRKLTFWSKKRLQSSGRCGAFDKNTLIRRGCEMWEEIAKEYIKNE